MIRALPILILLAACQQSPEAGGNAAAAANASAPAGYSEVQQRVVSLPAQQRYGVLLRAIRDGNAPCQGVAEEIRQADQEGNPAYVARCTDGPVYAIVVDRNGVAQVTRVSAERRQG
ncbi:MAG TPA: hypothetical protein VF636_09700 [Sphingomonas sp.]|jgi:hypothetical protein